MKTPYRIGLENLKERDYEYFVYLGVDGRTLLG
jgi:hypothetical protein